MDFLLKGLIIGVSIAAPVGPIGVLCIRRTLANGRSSGFFSGLGAATADACFGSVAAFGLTFISNLLVGQQFWFRLIGGVFLCYLGIKTLLDKPVSIGKRAKKEPAKLDQNEGTASLDGDTSSKIYRQGEKISDRRGLLADYFSTFLLTLTNPMTILSFTAIFAGLGIVSSGGSSPQGAAVLSAFTLVLGVFLGSAFWWLILSNAANLLRAKFLKPEGLRWVNWISGAIITGFGIVALSSALTLRI